MLHFLVLLFFYFFKFLSNQIAFPCGNYAIFSSYFPHIIPPLSTLHQELEERLRHHHHAELQSLREAHRQSIETLKQQSEQELQTLRFELEDEGKAMLGEGCRVLWVCVEVCKHKKDYSEYLSAFIEYLITVSTSFITEYVRIYILVKMIHYYFI